MPKPYNSKWTKFTTTEPTQDEYNNNNNNNNNTIGGPNTLYPSFPRLNSPPSLFETSNNGHRSSNSTSQRSLVRQESLCKISSEVHLGITTNTVEPNGTEIYPEDSESSSCMHSYAAWKVWKFGGTSMGSFENISNVANLVSKAIQSHSNLIIVVSAVGGITSMLQECCNKALEQYKSSKSHNNSAGYTELLDVIAKKHTDIICDMFDNHHITIEDKESFQNSLLNDIVSITTILTAIELSGKVSRDLNDYVIGQGEIWSSKLLNLCLPYHLERHGQRITSNQDNAYPKENTSPQVSLHHFDSREFLIVFDRSDPESAFWSLDYAKNQVFVDWSSSQKKLNAYFKLNFSLKDKNNKKSTNNISQLVVMTGFICSYPNGTMTNLGRNGSDYSASLISALVSASELTVWSDVDGIYSADPRMVTDAILLNHLTYTEAMELSYFGAKVLHPFSIHPCIRNKIPILLKNSFRPTANGTIICDEMPPECEHSNQKRNPCKAITTIPYISLITLEGTHMIGVSGIASKLFHSLNSCNCSIILISQGSSEHSICLAIRSSELKPALLAIHNAFVMELEVTNTMNLYYDEDCTILSAVGEGMSGCIGTLANLSSALSNALVNIKAVTQGPGEHNISFVVDGKDTKNGLMALHTAAFRNNLAKASINEQKSQLIILITSDLIRKIKLEPETLNHFISDIPLSIKQKSNLSENYNLLALTDAQEIAFLKPHQNMFDSNIDIDFWDDINSRDDLDMILWDLTTTLSSNQFEDKSTNSKQLIKKQKFLTQWKSDIKPIIDPTLNKNLVS